MIKKILLLSALFLTGCGFHLRGDMPIPPELATLYLKTDKPYDPLSKTLHEVFETAGVHFVDSANESPTTLDIVKEQQGANVTNVGTNTTTLQYNLTYSVTYRLLDRNGKLLAGPFTASENSTLMMTSNSMLSGNQTQAQMQAQMQHDAAEQILNILTAPDTIKR